MTRERQRRVIESTWPDVAHEAVDDLMREDGDDEFYRKYWTTPSDVLGRLEEHFADELFFQDLLLKHRRFLRKDAYPPFSAEDFGDSPESAVMLLHILYAQETARRTAWNQTAIRPDGTRVQRGRSTADRQPNTTDGEPIEKLTTTCEGMWPPRELPDDE